MPLSQDNSVSHSGSLYYLKNKEDALHIFQEIPYSFDKGTLDKRTTIYTKEPHLEIWNDGLMFQGILHSFSKRWCIFLKGHIPVKTNSLQRMPWPLEQITAYINETEFEMVLESVSRRFHAFIAFYAILYVLKAFFKILLQSFQAEISVPSGELT